MRLLTYAELRPQKGVPYSREHVRRLVKLKQFPAPVKTGIRAIAWLESEVDAHVAEMGWTRVATTADERQDQQNG
jgi:predicted DNA-binding transcriptional regulator AlpA